jgi:hypothetical protein
MKSSNLLIMCAGLTSLSVAAFWADAGPLTPPAGPVSSTSPSLSSLETSINALAGADTPADTSTTPGDAFDGRPLMIAEGQTGLAFVLEIAGFGSSYWYFAEFGESVNVVLQQVVNQQGQQLTVPVAGGRALPQVMLVRDLTTDPVINSWWDLVKDGNVAAARTSASLIVFDNRLNEIARWNLYNCWPAALDHRAIDGQMAEQIRIVGEQIERVFN